MVNSHPSIIPLRSLTIARGNTSKFKYKIFLQDTPFLLVCGLGNPLFVYSLLGSQELAEVSHWSSTTKFTTVIYRYNYLSLCV